MFLQATEPSGQLDRGNLTRELVQRLRMTARRTNQILQLAGPQSVVLIEGVLVNNSLQTSHFLLLCNDLLGDIVKHGLHCEKLALPF